MTSEREIQRSRAAQVGFLMRSYRESFSLGQGGRGITQEQLLRRMGSVDSTYAQRYSHATVSRWESGNTRPTLRRLQIFGTALELSPTEVAGLILLAGLAPDFKTASTHSSSSAIDEIGGDAEPSDHDIDLSDADEAVESVFGNLSSLVGNAVHLGFLRYIFLGVAIAGGGYAFSALGWTDSWMLAIYVAVATGIVLAQGFLLPDKRVGLKEFYWISIFFLLTTPLLQFAPLGMDHYNFYTIGNFGGTQIPYMLSLLLNLTLAFAAGWLFKMLWYWQYGDESYGHSPVQRSAWVALPPTLLVYAVVVVITNVSVSIQLAILLPVLAFLFTLMLILRDPEINPSEHDRRFLLTTVIAAALVSAPLGVIGILAIYVSPDLPMVLPDHNLLTSWEINFAELGFSKEEALDRLNLGYIWHATCLFMYIFFIVGGNAVLAIYRQGGSDEER